MNRPLTLTPKELDAFPANYHEARKALKTLSQNCPQLEDIQSYPLSGASNSEHDNLSTETLWLGPSSAENLVVLISATHGVEGFVGAAVQTDLLQRIQRDALLPTNTALLMIFALNPFGFAQHRRCDEMGIDLNRNFIDFSQPLPANKGYDQLQSAVYEENPIKRQALFEEFQRQQGQTAFEIALSGGQYSDRYGPFYGGHQPAHGHCVINQIIENYQLASRHLAVIDIHSGLGPYAYGELINDHPIASSCFQTANRWYGASVTSPAAGNSSSVRKAGLLDYRWHQLMTERGSFITLEFGSYRIQDMFEVVLENHRSWKSGNPQAIHQSAHAMLEHFCPQDNYWRELVLIKGRQVIQQALSGLQNG